MIEVVDISVVATDTKPSAVSREIHIALGGGGAQSNQDHVTRNGTCTQGNPLLLRFIVSSGDLESTRRGDLRCSRREVQNDKSLEATCNMRTL